MATSEISSLIQVGDALGTDIDDNELRGAISAAQNDFSVENVESLRAVSEKITPEKNSLTAKYVEAIKAMPTVSKLNKKKIKGGILDKHKEMLAYKKKRAESKTFTASKSTPSIKKEKKPPTSTLFEKALEWQRLKAQLQSYANKRDAARQTALM